MQVAPIKPVLKAPGTILLKLRCDKPLSNIAFKFNLRRHTEGGQLTAAGRAAVVSVLAKADPVGRCRLNL